MKKFLALCILAVGLAGCANITNAWDTLTGARISPAAVYVEQNVAIGLERVAQHYLVVCHQSPVLQVCGKDIEAKVVFAVRKMRKANTDLRGFMKTHPDALGAQGLYDALVGAAGEFKSIYDSYNLGSVQ